MTKPSVYVNQYWAGPTIKLFESFGYPLASSPETCDILALNGGEDIHPKLYGQEPMSAAGVTWLDEERDRVELQDYEKAKHAFKFGICRGGQLLNVLNGGQLWQDVDQHNRPHDMIDLETGETIWTSSVHHQQFILGEGAQVIAVAGLSTRKIGWFSENLKRTKPAPGVWYRGESNPLYNDDPEVVYYPKDRALCIQGHPEYAGYSQFTKYCMGLLEKLYG